jgi:hypothetical protein
MHQEYHAQAQKHCAAANFRDCLAGINLRADIPHARMEIMSPPRRSPKKLPEAKAVPAQLKGWSAIAEYLGQTPSVAKRWHREGMPVTKNGRSVDADPAELTKWVGTEAGKPKPIHISSENENLTADLKEALSFVRGRGARGGDVDSPDAPRLEKNTKR